MKIIELEKLVYALTLADRPEAREGWISKGFHKVNRRSGFLLNYWKQRLEKMDHSDIEMYLDVLAKYKATLGKGGLGQNAIKAASKWIKSGLQVASDATIESRRAACEGCEFWDHSALQGTGKCRICGCSTWAKIRMATESCPNGIWGAEK